MNPILSIVIATKNRVPYCINAIDTILSFPDNDFELIIQDNTDNLELKTYIESNISDKRLVYNYTPPPFSSIDNFNAAIGLSIGEFVCLIGDDDGVIPEILKIARWASSKGIDSVCSTALVSYGWPGVYPKFIGGVLFIPNYSEKIQFLNPLKKIPALLNNGLTDYSKFNLPRVYHGLIKRSCFEQIEKKTGHYFGGLSPDIYSSIALGAIVKKHLVLDIPFTIPGVCTSSTSSDSSKQKHCGNLEDAPHFRSRENYVWESEIPRYYSVQTIWAESGFKSMKENKLHYSSKMFSLERMVALSIISSYSIFKTIIIETNNLLNKNRKSLIFFYGKVFFYIFLQILKLIPQKIKNFFLRIIPSKNIIHNITDISKASRTTSEIFCTEKYSFLYKS